MSQPPKRLIISGMSFFSSAARQVAPGILLICVLMPMAASDSWISTAIGSPTVAPPRSKLSVVSKPLGTPASAISALALAMSVL